MHSAPIPNHDLSAQDWKWIKYINRLIDQAIEVGKDGDPKKVCRDYQLLLAFFEGDENKAGEYFMSYCTRVRACPPDFIGYYEEVLKEAGIELPQSPTYEMPEKLLQAAE